MGTDVFTPPSIMVRPFPRPSRHDQPFQRVHASADCRDRTQYGLCTTVSLRSFLGPVILIMLLTPTHRLQRVQLSLIHPRLFHTLALNEPIIQNAPPSGPNAAYFTSSRSDLWPSREKAQALFRKNPFFKHWDLRAFDLFLQYGLRDTPSAIYPEAAAGAVTLMTTKHQEAWSYVRSNFTAQSTDRQDPTERLVSPDMDPDNEGSYLFHRAEPCLALQSLPHIRPSTLWIFGAKSPINTPALQVEKLALTGTGVGGSGGEKAGRVTKIDLDAGHMAPLERVKETAETLARWLEKELERFKKEEIFYRNYNSGKSERHMMVLSKQWMAGVRQKANIKRPIKGKL